MVSEIAGRGARFSGKGGMPSMWDQGAPGEQGAYGQQSGSGPMWDQGAQPQRSSMWDRGAPQEQPGGSGRSMWDQGPSRQDQPAAHSMGQSGAHPGVHPVVNNMGQPMNRPMPQTGNSGNAGRGAQDRPVLMGPQGPQTGNIKTGTVKSYSVVKGFGFILAPEIPQDIYFGRDSLQADLRTSDVAGTTVTFELIRAPDGKPQGRNLRPVGNVPMTAAAQAADDQQLDRQQPIRSGRDEYDGSFRGHREGPTVVQPSSAPFRPMGAQQGRGPDGSGGGCWPGMQGMQGMQGMMQGMQGMMQGMMAGKGPMGMGMGMGPMGMGPMGMGCGGGCFPGKGAINPAFMGKPGFMPPPMPGRPGFPMGMNPGMMPGKGPGMMPGMVRPGDPMGMRPGMPGAPGMMGGMMGGKPMADRRRDWSPHAGSRAIKQSLLNPLQPAEEAGEKKSERSESSRSRSRSRRSRSSSSSSRSRSRRRKKNKKKKKRKGKRSRSSSTISSSSSDGKAEKKDKDKDKDKDKGAASGSAGAEGDDPDIAKAKMEALDRLKKMQSVEPKEERSKQFRALLREWHPDKNPEKAEVATAVFQFLQKGKSLLNLK